MTKSETPNSDHVEINTGRYSEFVTKIFYIISLYVCFVFSGIFEEKLYKTNYIIGSEKVKFHHPSLAIMANSIIASFIANIVLMTMKTQKDSPFKKGDKLMLGSYFVLSKLTAENSINYLDFISKIIGKSCKSVAIIMIYYCYNLPVIGPLLKKLVNQEKASSVHSHGYNDLVKVVITTLSIILFNCEDAGASKGQNYEVIKTILLGYGLLILSLIFDAFMALKEKIIHHEVHHNPSLYAYQTRLSWEYMSLFSNYSILFCSIALGYGYFTSDLVSDLRSYFSSPELIQNMICYAIAASLGQVFLFQILEKFGPLTVSIITGVRKIISIALSIIIFGKTVSLVKIISLLLGTTVIGWEICDKTIKNDKKSDKVKDK